VSLVQEQYVRIATSPRHCNAGLHLLVPRKGLWKAVRFAAVVTIYVYGIVLVTPNEKYLKTTLLAIFFFYIIYGTWQLFYCHACGLVLKEAL